MCASNFRCDRNGCVKWHSKINGTKQQSVTLSLYEYGHWPARVERDVGGSQRISTAKMVTGGSTTSENLTTLVDTEPHERNFADAGFQAISSTNRCYSNTEIYI